MSEPKQSRPFKKCGCGRDYSKEEWEELALTQKNGGRMRYADGITYEFRLCADCSTTLAVTVLPPKTEQPTSGARPVHTPAHGIEATAMLRVSSSSK